MTKKYFMISVLSLYSLSLQAEIMSYNTDYRYVDETKVWQRSIDVYLEDGVLNECGNSDLRRFRINENQNENQMYSSILMALAGKFRVNLRYECLDGVPSIIGVRLKP